jgi:antagonist of KipI
MPDAASGSQMAFRVIKPGLLTTVQDKGRFGQQQYGLSPCGAMDTLALRVGNRLVGNPEGLSALEFITPAPELEVLEECQIAIAGGEFSACLDGESLAAWENYLVQPGQRITFVKRLRGSRAYLCVEGGVQGDWVLGSYSTDLKAKLGGIAGRPLKAGDFLCRGSSCFQQRSNGKRFAAMDVLREYRNPFVLRVVAGPQADYFGEDELRCFYRSQFRLQPSSGRMGYRLIGTPIRPAKSEIISEPASCGGIQSLPDGKLILLMADHPTIGGYPKIAVVISADIHKAAQLWSGHLISFEEVKLDTAHQLLMEQERLLARSVIDFQAVTDSISAVKGEI